jgi:hypothetical protein
MKALDLRLEIGKAFNDFDVLISGIEERLAYVRKSHYAVLSAIGLFQSGQRQKFEADFENDKARVRVLLKSQPKREVDYRRRDTDYLESLLSSIHASHVQLSEIRNKYERIFEADEARRSDIRAQHQ